MSAKRRDPSVDFLADVTENRGQASDLSGIDLRSLDTQVTGLQRLGIERLNRPILLCGLIKRC
jgi:hypothetical protein